MFYFYFLQLKFVHRVVKTDTGSIKVFFLLYYIYLCTFIVRRIPEIVNNPFMNYAFKITFSNILDNFYNIVVRFEKLQK